MSAELSGTVEKMFYMKKGINGIRVITSLSVLAVALSLDAVGKPTVTFSRESGNLYLKSFEITPVDILYPDITYWSSVRERGTYVYVGGHATNLNTLRFRCYTPKNIDSYYRIPRDPSDPKRIEYSRRAAIALSSCDWAYVSGERVNVDTSIVNVDYWDGYVYSWATYTGLQFYPTGKELESPNLCVISQLTNVDFGVVKTGSSAYGEGSLSVNCSQDSTISLVVNNGHDLETPEGSVISFESTTPISVVGGHSYNVPIKANLYNGPSNPGYYRWAANIVISYD